MDNPPLNRSVEFAAFLIGAVLFMVFGVEFLVSGLVDWVVECVSSSFPQQCSGNQVWQILAPVISGAILVFLAILFLILAYRARHADSTMTPSPP